MLQAIVTAPKTHKRKLLTLQRPLNTMSVALTAEGYWALCVDARARSAEFAAEGLEINAEAEWQLSVMYYKKYRYVLAIGSYICSGIPLVSQVQ